MAIGKYKSGEECLQKIAEIISESTGINLMLPGNIEGAAQAIQRGLGRVLSSRTTRAGARLAEFFADPAKVAKLLKKVREHSLARPDSGYNTAAIRHITASIEVSLQQFHTIAAKSAEGIGRQSQEQKAQAFARAQGQTRAAADTREDMAAKRGKRQVATSVTQHYRFLQEDRQSGVQTVSATELEESPVEKSRPGKPGSTGPSLAGDIVKRRDTVADHRRQQDAQLQGQVNWTRAKGKRKVPERRRQSILSGTAVAQLLPPKVVSEIELHAKRARLDYRQTHELFSLLIEHSGNLFNPQSPYYRMRQGPKKDSNVGLTPQQVRTIAAWIPHAAARVSGNAPPRAGKRRENSGSVSFDWIMKAAKNVGASEEQAKRAISDLAEMYPTLLNDKKLHRFRKSIDNHEMGHRPQEQEERAVFAAQDYLRRMKRADRVTAASKEGKAYEAWAKANSVPLHKEGQSIADAMKEQAKRTALLDKVAAVRTKRYQSWIEANPIPFRKFEGMTVDELLDPLYNPDTGKRDMRRGKDRTYYLAAMMDSDLIRKKYPHFHTFLHRYYTTQPDVKAAVDRHTAMGDRLSPKDLDPHWSDRRENYSGFRVAYSDTSKRKEEGFAVSDAQDRDSDELRGTPGYETHARRREQRRAKDPDPNWTRRDQDRASLRRQWEKGGPVSDRVKHLVALMDSPAYRPPKPYERPAVKGKKRRQWVQDEETGMWKREGQVIYKRFDWKSGEWVNARGRGRLQGLQSRIMATYAEWSKEREERQIKFWGLTEKLVQSDSRYKVDSVSDETSVESFTGMGRRKDRSSPVDRFAFDVQREEDETMGRRGKRKKGSRPKEREMAWADKFRGAKSLEEWHMHVQGLEEEVGEGTGMGMAALSFHQGDKEKLAKYGLRDYPASPYDTIGVKGSDGKDISSADKHPIYEQEEPTLRSVMRQTGAVLTAAQSGKKPTA